jgi:hypothetical protein
MLFGELFEHVILLNSQYNSSNFFDELHQLIIVNLCHFKNEVWNKSIMIKNKNHKLYKKDLCDKDTKIIWNIDKKQKE